VLYPVKERKKERDSFFHIIRVSKGRVSIRIYMNMEGMDDSLVGWSFEYSPLPFIQGLHNIIHGKRRRDLHIYVCTVIPVCVGVEP
jgi:hypothetical protein